MPIAREKTSANEIEGLPRTVLERLIFGGQGERRFTQDSPVLPDVWIHFGKRPDDAHELLLTPHRKASAGNISVALRQRLGKSKGHNISYISSSVAARLRFDELVHCVIPMTSWWEKRVWRDERFRRIPEGGLIDELTAGLRALVREHERDKRYVPIHRPQNPRLAPDFLWMLRIIGWIDWARSMVKLPEPGELERDVEAWMHDYGPKSLEQVRRAVSLFQASLVELPEEVECKIWQINRNRAARFAIHSSRLAIKADAAHELFKVSCQNLAWAVIDGGIDATHRAFRLRVPGSNPPRFFDEAFLRKDESQGSKWINQTRVVGTYDFTSVRT